MLNINIIKKKINKILLSINKLIESFFSNIHDYIKEYKKNNSKFKKINDRFFLGFVGVGILILSYFLIPSFYNEELLKSKLENQIKERYNLKVNFKDKISYSLFPKPHYYVENLDIFQSENVLINSKNSKIYISIKNFFSFEKLNIKNVIFQDNEFNIKRKNLSFFINLLNSNNSDDDIVFKDSIIFYKDSSNDVIFLVDLNYLKFFYDKEKKYQSLASYKIFNLPFKFNLTHDTEKKIFSFDLGSKNIRTKINNSINYGNEKIEGVLETQILNDINHFLYSVKNNSFNIKSKDNSFSGDIDLKPFYLSSNFTFEEFDIKNFLKENSIFINLINSEILNNQNINADLNINLKKIKNFKYLEKINIKAVLEEGNIYFKDINTNWNNSILIKINDTQLINDINKVNLIGSITFDFTDLEKFYRYYQISKKFRKNIKRIKFDFYLNLDEKQIQISNAKIDNLPNDQINIFLDELNLQKKNFFNRVIFRNFVKKFFEFYQEG